MNPAKHKQIQSIIARLTALAEEMESKDISANVIIQGITSLQSIVANDPVTENELMADFGQHAVILKIHPDNHNDPQPYEVTAEEVEAAKETLSKLYQNQCLKMRKGDS